MNTMLLRTFQRQVALQCRYIMLAAHDVNKGLQEGDIPYTYYGIQNLLNAAANVSKALWGQGGKYAEIRKPLRDSIGVSDVSPLRNVNMRNNFEHFDERLDRWWVDSKNHNIADMNIGPPNMIVGLASTDTFRTFDPATTNLIFWGEDFSIQAIVSEAETLLPKLEEEADKPHWT